MNLPNAITIGRIALVPVFWVLAFREGTSARVTALVVYVVASLSDWIDGYLARRGGTTSRAGAFLDPTADKLLLSAGLIVLVSELGFPLWAALILAAREVVMQVYRTNLVRAGGSLPASAIAKLKTFVLTLMVGWWLLPWDERNVMHWILLGVALGYSLVSAMQYFVRQGPRKSVF